MEIIESFKVTIMIMLFYSFAITILAYSLPTESLNTIDSYTELSNSFGMEKVSEKITDSVERETNIPIIEVGALIFYSGNIIIDLLLNFTYAIPQMVGLITRGLVNLFGFSGDVWVIVETFAFILINVMYFIGLLQLIASIRSGQKIA